VGGFLCGQNSGHERTRLQPIAMGKLYHAILSFSNDKLEILSSLVDFDGEFMFMPLKLKVPAARKSRKRSA